MRLFDITLCNAIKLKLLTKMLVSLLFQNKWLCTSLKPLCHILGGGFCPIGSWRRIPRKGPGCLQSQPPMKREDKSTPLFWPQCFSTRPKERRWSFKTWRMSVFSLQPWYTSNICMASYRCLGCVWGLSELLWILSGGYDVKAIDKHPIRLIFISLFLFSQLPGSGIGQIVLYFGVSGRCLEGVWEVSGGCLGDSGYCAGGYDMQAIDNHPIRVI